MRLKNLLFGAITAALLATQSFAFRTDARAAFVIDHSTGTVLLEKRADVPFPPASMSKLMTLYMTFEAIREGRLSWTERLPVSRHAMAYRGSTMFLDTSDRVSVQDLVRGIIVLSGNDACAVIAEALSFDGSEAGFAQMMTKRAKELGMTASTFANSNGWPDPNQRMSMRDLGILANRLITDFPEHYPLFAERVFEFDGRAPANTQNRNPLLGLGIGADGLKTGHTEEAGYGLVGSAKLGDRRIIFVISGLPSARARAIEAERINTWAFRQFSTKTIAPAGDILAEVPVWMGKQRTVGLTTATPLKILTPITGSDGMTTTLTYQGPIEAPIKQGDVIAELVVTTPGLPDHHIPLMASTGVERGGVVTRLRTAAQVLWGNIWGRD